MAKKMKSETASKGAGKGPWSAEMLDRINAYWRAANYLPVGQIYLNDNPLLKRPPTLAQRARLLLTPQARIGPRPVISGLGADRY